MRKGFEVKMLKHFMYIRRRKKYAYCWLVVAFFFVCMYYIYGNKYAGVIPVFVVEEHHEALIYWITAANEGAVSKAGNTLIHIDGHSDTGLPEYNPFISNLDWPSITEIDGLMQKNDVFIVEAVNIGLFQRVIWITPDWNNETKHFLHYVDEVEIGTTKIVINDEEITVFCKCERKEEEGKEHASIVQRECAYSNMSFVPPDSPEIVLSSPELCKVHTAYTLEVLSAEAALKYKRTDEEWLDMDENIVLDIDLDYFGCEIPGQKLIDVGMKWPQVQLLDSKLESMFCPKFMEHEKAGSDMMMRVLKSLIENCSNRDSSKCEKPLDSVIAECYAWFLSSWMSDPLLYCARNDLNLKYSVQELVKAFYNLTSSHLLSILQLGFCFNTSPRTIWFEEHGQLEICHGANDPTQPLVQVYVPQREEVQKSLQVVEALLENLPAPRLVTVCRSLRDGYTPRSIATHVQRAVLDFFTVQQQKSVSSEREQHKYRVYYDENLLNVSFT